MTNFVGVYYNPILIVICTDLFIVLKTASLLVRLKSKKSNCFTLSKQPIKSLILSTLLLVFMTSCSTKKVIVPSKAPLVLTETIKSDTSSAEQHIERAKKAKTTVAIDELLTATTLFYQEKNYLKALWLSDKTLQLVDNKIANSMQKKVQLVLIKASSLQQLGYYSESRLQLNQLKQYANDNNIALTAMYYQLQYLAYQQEKRPIPALTAQLWAFDMTKPADQNRQQIESIWQNLQRLSQWQLGLLAIDKVPKSQGWLQLITLANKFGGNKGIMQYHLKIWQSKYKLHPANVIVKQLRNQNLNPKKIENIAVILPLSGKQKPAGLAIQQGVLASFSNDKTKKLHFLDSNTVNWYGLTNQFSTLKIDYVIGPLLKSNVDKYINHTSPQTQSKNDQILNANSSLFSMDQNKDEFDIKGSLFKESDDYITAIDSTSAINRYLQPTTQSKAINTLLLNIPDKASLTNQHTVLSMRPEDEAKQAAATLSRQHFKHPIVLSQQGVVSKRIAQAFAEQWQITTGNTIEVVYYSTGAQMQANIKASLSVDKSKERITKLTRRLNQSIKTQTRNRRDVDMIYLVGTPEQTRLVKPYIEVNISPFAKVIPVYASSRSHSTRSNKSSSNDLRGLIFTEIPWLLTGEQNTELATLNNQLWPKRSDSLSRLFAMGFDSYQLINKIPLMQQAPYLQHWGQTGVLKLDENNILTRSLLWGTYQADKVVSIAVE